MVNQEGLRAEPLLLRIERSKRWIGHLVRMVGCPGHVPPVGDAKEDPEEDPRHDGGTMILSWSGNVLESQRKIWPKLLEKEV